MSDFTPKDEPKFAPTKPKYSDLNFTNTKPAPLQPIPGEPKYSELEYIAANNKLLANIEVHLRSIQGMLQFFVVIVVLSIILGGCSAFFAIF